jgi:hypothetical protein
VTNGALISFLDEDELQEAIACEPSLLNPVLRQRDQGMVAMTPREFPLLNSGPQAGQERIDGLAVAIDGTLILIECKLVKGGELRGTCTAAPKVIRQAKRYSDRLRSLSPYRLNGDLSSFLKRYGVRINDHLRDLWGSSFCSDTWLDRVGKALREDRLITVVVVDELDRAQHDALTRGAAASGLDFEILRVDKRQTSESELPVFGSESLTHAMTPASRPQLPGMARPIRSRLWDTERLPKMHPRVRAVRPPRQLRLEERWWWSRDPNPEEHHAVDPSRTASFIPVMPDLGMLADNGSPYPDVDHAPTVLPYPPGYRPWLQIGREVWRTLLAQGEVESERDGSAILTRAKRASMLLREHPMITRFGDRAVSGALRDLSLFEIGTLMRLPSTSNRMNWRLLYQR